MTRLHLPDTIRTGIEDDREVAESPEIVGVDDSHGCGIARGKCVCVVWCCEGLRVEDGMQRVDGYVGGVLMI